MFAVLGGKHETLNILHLLTAFGIEVAACHDETGVPNQSGNVQLSRGKVLRHARQIRNSVPGRQETIPRLGCSEFAALIDRSDINLIIASHHVTNQADSFIDACQYAREKLGFVGQPIHLSALCDLHRFRQPRFLLTGVASSGNMVFQNILRVLFSESGPNNTMRFLKRLRARFKPDAQAQTDHMLASFAYHHARSLMRTFAQAIRGVANDQVLGSRTHLRFGQVLVQSDDQYCARSGLPLRSYAWDSPFTGTHDPMTAETVDFYASQGYEIIYILRNPLDVLVSNAAKVSTVIPGERQPHLALGNEQWFAEMLAALCAHYQGFLANSAKLRVVRYEALMSDPASEIARLCSMIGIRLPASRIHDIWRQLDGVPVAGEKHFWKPGAGKWKRHLNARHRDMVFATQLPEISRALGYEIDTGDFRGLVTDPNEGAADSHPRLSWIDAILEIPIGKPLSFSGDLVRVRNEALGIVGFFDRAHATAGKRLVNSPDVELLVRSAYWEPPANSSTTVRGYLGL